MLEQIDSMFDNYSFMVGMKSATKEPILKKKGKKANYEANMILFRKENGHFIQEMTDHMDGAEDKAKAAEEISRIIADTVSEKYVGGKWDKGRRIVDLNFFLIYYVFPSILLTENANAVVLCDTLRDTWNQKFGQQIGYTDYNTLFSGFNEKIFGIL